MSEIFILLKYFESPFHCIGSSSITMAYVLLFQEDLSGVRSEGASTPTVTQDMSARQRSLLNIVQKEQKKWKGTVQEQRKNIYDRHSMLN